MENFIMEESVLTANQVASALLYFHNESENNGEILPPLDKVKMDKMVYYAFAHWLAQTRKPLFHDCDIVAEEIGPVIQGMSKPSELGNGIVNGLPEKVRKFLRGIHKALKEYPGIELSYITCNPGEPWHYVSCMNRRDFSSKPVIPNVLIEEVFSQKIFMMKIRR